MYEQIQSSITIIPVALYRTLADNNPAWEAFAPDLRAFSFQPEKGMRVAGQTEEEAVRKLAEVLKISEGNKAFSIQYIFSDKLTYRQIDK